MEDNVLQNRISELEAENAFLKSLLEQAGIAYTVPDFSEKIAEQNKYDPNQGERIISVEITHNQARRFFSYFWGRMDVFSKRYQNKNTGKSGYFPQCDNFWKRGICPKTSGNKIKCKDCSYRAWTKLEASHIEAHLRGDRDDASDVIGVYPLFPDGTCRFLVFDFDNHSKGAEENDYANVDSEWKEEVNSIREICRLNGIPRLAAFSNPEYFKNQAIGLSNYAQSRFIYLGEDDNGYICIPRGLWDRLQEKCLESGIKVQVEDKRCIGRTIEVRFSGELRPNQKTAIEELLRHDCGILSAATAFGKTVACSGIIAEKRVSTLILLESSALVEQWEKALNSFLEVNEELPEYQTKTGRTKKRKSVIGLIQGPKDTSTGIIDIAMAGSLFKKGEPHPRLKEYGLVLVDECHHSASDTVSAVLKEASAKYVYGVTATPFRGDGLERVNYMLLGPVRYQYSAKAKAAEQGIEHLVIPRFTRAVSPHGKEKMHVNEAYELIRDHTVRNDRIFVLTMEPLYHDKRSCCPDMGQG